MEEIRESYETILELCAKIKPVEKSLYEKAQHKVDLKTKPPGSLGKIEELAVRLSGIQGDLEPRLDTKKLFVFAGDHGVVAEGVSAFPAEVTSQMVENFLAGGAAINVFCRQYGIEMAVIDMGVNHDFAARDGLIDMKVARGTANFAKEPAMTRDQAIAAMVRGAEVFLASNREKNCDIVGLGEMGIGNTTTATAVLCAASGKSAQELTGRGTGIDDAALARKQAAIEKALALHRPEPRDGLELLRLVGGFELGGICGMALAAASTGCAVVLDGIISTTAGLLAYCICPAISDYLIAGHQSVERGQLAALKIMGLKPVIDLDFRLGEGTGAAVTMNLAELSCKMMREMASFDEAGVCGEKCN